MKKEDIIFHHLKHPILNHRRNISQKTADRLTALTGSWIFIMVLFVFILTWTGINGYVLLSYKVGQPFDPYPFVFLNLVLACLTAIQGPIILMSQNRQAHKDQLKAEYDYRINKKAEKEIQEIKRLLLKK
jgi:uncharacterized membrane protein